MIRELERRIPELSKLDCLPTCCHLWGQDDDASQYAKGSGLVSATSGEAQLLAVINWKLPRHIWLYDLAQLS